MPITDWTTKSTDRIRFNDAAIGTLALISMYQTVTFLLLQLLVFIPVTVIDLLMDSQGWNEETKEMVVLTLLVSMELSLIIILAKRGKTRFEQYMTACLDQRNDDSRFEAPRRTTAITETHLELSLGLAALAGISWCLMQGMHNKSIQIVLIVIEGAALLFLSIFVIIRFLTTRKVRPTALACLILSCLSLWTLLQ